MVPCRWRHSLAPCELGSLSLYVPPFHNRNNLGHPYSLGLGCNLHVPFPGAGTGSDPGSGMDADTDFDGDLNIGSGLGIHGSDYLERPVETASWSLPARLPP